MEENINEDSILFASYFEYEKLLFSPNPLDIHEALKKLEELIKNTSNNVLINKIFLQIANLYASALNQIRYQILEFFTRNKKFMAIVLNKKEMLDLIFTSLYSNDYISRTITIKIICQLAEFYQERFDIFHQLHHILESSTVYIEKKNSFLCLEKFMKESKKLSKAMLNKIHAFIIIPENLQKTKINLINFYIKLTGKLVISFEDLDPAFQINMKFLSFSKTNEISKKALIFLLKHQVQLCNNSGMFIEYSIDFLKNLLEKETDLSYYIRYLKLFIKLFQIAQFYQEESIIDINFLLTLLLRRDFSEEIIELFCSFLKELIENPEFIKCSYEFLTKNIETKSCFLLFLVLSKKFSEKNVEIDYSMFMKIFDPEENLFWFKFVNENREELAFIFSKLANINALPVLFQKIGGFFKKILDNLNKSVLNIQEKGQIFCLNILIFLQNLKISELLNGKSKEYYLFIEKNLFYFIDGLHLEFLNSNDLKAILPYLEMTYTMIFCLSNKLPYENHVQCENILKSKIEILLEEFNKKQRNIVFKEKKRFLTNLFKKTITHNFFLVAQILNEFLKNQSSNSLSLYYFNHLEYFLQFFTSNLACLDKNLPCLDKNSQSNDEFISNKTSIILNLIPLFENDETLDFKRNYLKLFYDFFLFDQNFYKFLNPILYKDTEFDVKNIKSFLWDIQILLKKFDEFINKFQNLDVISKNSLQTSILAYKAIEILLKSFLFHETENERFILFFQSLEKNKLDLGDGENRIIQIIMKNLKSKELFCDTLKKIHNILFDMLNIQHFAIPRAFCQTQYKITSLSFIYKNLNKKNKEKFITFNAYQGGLLNLIIRAINIEKHEKNFSFCIENELTLIVDKENSYFKTIHIQKNLEKINPLKLELMFDLLLTFPHIGEFLVNTSVKILDVNMNEIAEKKSFIEIKAI